ncbi:uncharacterized protein LOC122063958 isoform X3 [Macadamia integrifolia]|uniref:uncharacterized protein LOC122063958 isoform X3 n=1 Tax=Macadamia integrifolia TaxID=60698 RepID=UPI001C4E82FC|nr:uncharacterized protein LOC122063958 isoform X3 [Macadamia integrifolia]
MKDGNVQPIDISSMLLLTPHREEGLKPMEDVKLRENAYKMVDFIADYCKNIESFPVLSQALVTCYLFIWKQEIDGKCLASSFTRGLFCCRENKKIKKSCERKSFPGFDMPVSLWTK